MLIFAVIAWWAAVLVLIYDAASFGVARRSGPLSFRSAVEALPLWKLTVNAVAPAVSYLAAIVAAYWAFGFVGLGAPFLAWLILRPLADRAFVVAVERGAVELDDVVPCRWVTAMAGAVLAFGSLALALLAKA